LNRVAIDLTALLPVRTGVDRYLTELVTHLGRIDSTTQYSLYLNLADRSEFDRLPRNFVIHGWCARPRAVRFAFQQFVLPVACAASSTDVLHSPAFLMPICRGRVRHLVTVHDMTFFTMPEVHGRLHRSAAFRRLVRDSIRRADLINVPSAATREALLTQVAGLQADRIRITPLGVSTDYAPGAADDVARATRRLGLPDHYMLYVGTITPRKHLDLLVRSYRELLRSGNWPEHLVLAGAPGEAMPALDSLLRDPALQGRVHLTGFVPETDLPWVYRGARLFVYPSFGEGFGLPPLEAMACGVPVISMAHTSLRENLEGAADLVAPDDIDALTSALRRLLTDETWRARRRADGLDRAQRFRWDMTARKVLACYEELMQPVHRRRVLA
jgi:glycosyltransferase involved in cell wall biosynthesis